MYDTNLHFWEPELKRVESRIYTFTLKHVQTLTTCPFYFDMNVYHETFETKNISIPIQFLDTTVIEYIEVRDGPLYLIRRCICVREGCIFQS